MIGFIGVLGIAALGFASVFATVYGIVLSFQRHPLYGFASLFFTPFAFVVGITKIVGGKNLLETNKDIAA
jgi:hypothetical protein